MSEERSLQRFPIEQLGGVNRNLVDGLGTAPDKLKNLAFDRAGGWRYYGEFGLAESVTAAPLEVSAVSGDFGFYYGAGNDLVLHRSNPSSLWTDTVASITKWSSIPTVRYGPWRIIQGTASEVPSAGTATGYFATGTAAEATLPLGDYVFSTAEYVDTDKGKYLFAFENSGESPETSVSIETAGEGILITNESIHPRLVYLRDGPEGELDLTSGFVADLQPGEEREIVDPSEFLANSDIWIRSHHDLTEFHQGRMYVANPIARLFSLSALEPFNGPGWDRASSRIQDQSVVANDIPHGNLIFFSEVIPTVNPDAPGGVNMVRSLNYFSVPISSRSRILGLKSTPAGLLIFCDYEMFLFRGDPVSAELVRFSSSIGLDSGTKPVSMAGIVFSIYGGEVYMFSLGMGDVDFGGGASKISDPVYNLTDPFVELSVDRDRGQLIARTQNNLVFNYVASKQEWFENPFSGAEELHALLDYGGGPDIDGALFALHPAGGGTSLSFIKYDGNFLTGSDPAVFRFDNLDFGDKRARKIFRSVEVYVDDDYAPSVMPTMSYSVDGRSGSVAGNDLGEGRWVFRLPLGASGAQGSFEFLFSDLTVDNVIEPPIVFNVVPLGRRRI